MLWVCIAKWSGMASSLSVGMSSRCPHHRPCLSTFMGQSFWDGVVEEVSVLPMLMSGVKGTSLLASEMMRSCLSGGCIWKLITLS